MKLLKKIMIISGGFALAVGGCIACLSAPSFLSASAKVEASDNISTTALSSVAGGEIVVIGPQNDNNVYTVDSDWAKLSNVKTNWLKFETEISGDGFLLKDVDSGMYLNSAAAKKIKFDSSGSVFTLNGTSLKAGANTMCLNTSGLRPYSNPDQGANAHLYEISSISVTNISIKTNPTKTSYKEGELFDSTGMVLTVNYSEGEPKDVTEGFEWNLKEELKSTDSIVTISYQGKTATVNISVSALSGLRYEGTPTQTVYNEGQPFNTDGITVYASYSGFEDEDVTSKVSWNKLIKGNTSVTGTYRSRTIIVTGLTVKAAIAYTKLTSNDELKAGMSILFVSEKKSKACGSYNDSGSKTYLDSIPVTFTDGAIVPNDNLVPFILGGTAGHWTFTSTQGILRSVVEKSVIVDDGTEGSTWTINIETNGNATVVNENYSSLTLEHNDNNNDRFTTYTTLQGVIQIYGLSAGTIDDVITSIALNTTEDSTLAVGDTLDLVATLECGPDANKNINWSSSVDGVVNLNKTVSSSGDTVVVTGAATGETVITATSAGNLDKKASIKIKVEDPNVVTLVKIGEKDYAGICHLDNTKTLVATVEPDCASNKNVTWSVENSEIATINSSGVVSSVAPGKTNITARSVLTTSVSKTIAFYVFTQKGTKTTCPLIASDVKLAAIDNVWPEDVDADAYEESTGGQVFIKGFVASVPDKQSGKYSFDLTDEYGNTIRISKLASETNIEMSNEVHMIATYGQISVDGDSVTVTSPQFESVTSGTVAIKGITVTGLTSVKVGNTTTLKANFSPIYTSEKTVTWSSDDESVATVDNGVVTAVAEGTAVITATSTTNSAIKGSLTITVTPAVVAGVYTIGSNTTTQITAENADQIQANISGFDTSVFMMPYATNVKFGVPGNDAEDICFIDGTKINIQLSVYDYVISKVTIKEAKTTKVEAQVSVDGITHYMGKTDHSYNFYPFSSNIQITSNNDAFIGSIEITVTSTSNTDELYDLAGESMLSLTADACEALNVDNNTWANVKAAYEALVICDESIAAAVATAAADQAGDNVARGLARYDYILGVYNASETVHENFLGRTIVPVGRRMTVSVNTNIALIITIVGAVTVVSLVGVVFLLKKKKHN